MKKGIYKFFVDFRFGILEGIFVETSDNVQSIFGQKVHFGEVLGKHSDIFGTLDVGDISLVTEDEDAIRLFELYQMETGYNPFYYLNEEV